MRKRLEVYLGGSSNQLIYFWLSAFHYTVVSFTQKMMIEQLYVFTNLTYSNYCSIIIGEK